jgi:hypothetical protein
MQSAKSALEELSLDPQAARLARERADSLKLYHWTIAQAANEARLEGKREGELRGKLEGKHEALLAVLAARGLAVSEAAQARLVAESDPEVLGRWLVRAATAESIEQVFGP